MKFGGHRYSHRHTTPRTRQTSLILCPQLLLFLKKYDAVLISNRQEREREREKRETETEKEKEKEKEELLSTTAKRKKA